MNRLPQTKELRWIAVAMGLAGYSFPSVAWAADPTMADCITANESAGQLQADKKLRQAREQAAMCAAEACPVELHDTCRQRVADLNKSIPTIVFRAKGAGGADLTSVKVSMDGQVLADRLEGTAISVDPGQHTFRFETEGQPPVEQMVLVQEGEKDRAISIVIGEVAAVSPVPPPVSTSTVPAQAPTAGEVAPATGDGHTQRTIGLAVGGVGVAGLALGTGFGIAALSTKGSHCESGLCDPGSAGNVYRQATVSTVGFVAGGILVAGGVALFLMAPKGGNEATAAGFSVAPMVGASAGGLQLGGRW